MALANNVAPDPAHKGDGTPGAGQGSGEEHQETVPYERFAQVNEENRELRDQVARAEGRREGLAQTPSTPAPTETPAQTPTEVKSFTRIELERFVEEGRIDRSEIDTILANQLRTEVRNEVRQEISTALSEHDRSTRVSSQIGRYRRALPNLDKTGTEERQRLEDEYTYLTQQMKLPPTEETELIAARTAFGPIEKVESVRPVESQPLSHNELGTGDAGPVGNLDNQPLPNRGGPPAELKLTVDETRYYEDLIGKNIYSGWPAVAEEIKLADPRVRSRHGARV